MIRRQKVKALILGRRNQGEADRLLFLFGRSIGLLPVVAKGVRRVPSRRGGYLEPCTAVLALVSGQVRANYLAAVEPLEEYPKLHRDSAALAAGRRLAELVIQLFEAEDAQPRLFDALEQSWQLLPDLSAAKQNVLETTVTLYALQAAGLTPNLTSCQVCGVRLPSEAVILDGRQGGWHCLVCHQQLHGAQHSLPPNLLRVLRFITASPQRALRLNLDLSSSRQLVQAVGQYLQQIQDYGYQRAAVQD